jgi:hypothetical protein
MTTLQEIRDASLQAEYQIKLAAVSEAYEGDEQRLTLLGEAIELVKQAEAVGEIAPTTESSMLTLAVELVEDHIAKEASDEYYEYYEDYEGELDKEAAAHIATLAEAAGAILASRGITAEDLEKVASDEEMREIGEYVACAILDELEAEEQE